MVSTVTICQYGIYSYHMSIWSLQLPYANKVSTVTISQYGTTVIIRQYAIYSYHMPIWYLHLPYANMVSTVTVRSSQHDYHKNYRWFPRSSTIGWSLPTKRSVLCEVGTDFKYHCYEIQDSIRLALHPKLRRRWLRDRH